MAETAIDRVDAPSAGDSQLVHKESDEKAA